DRGRGASDRQCRRGLRRARALQGVAGAGRGVDFGRLRDRLLFVVRDFIRRRIGVAVSLCAVVMGATLSGVLIMQGFVLATTVALLLILLAIPFTRWLFKRDRRIGLEPA